MKRKDPVLDYRQKTPVNRADLLRCCGVLGVENLGVIAAIIGFIAKEEQKKRIKEYTKLPDIKGEVKEHTKQEVTEPKVAMEYFRVTGYRKKKPEETEISAPQWYKNATPKTTDELRSPAGIIPRQGPPLSSWSRLWPFLRKAMGHTRESRKPDFKHLIRLIASCIPVKKLPLLKRKSWASYCQVLFDFAARLTVFRQDLVFLLHHLIELKHHHLKQVYP